MTEVHGPKAQLRSPEYLRASFEPSDRLAILVRNGHRGEAVQRIATAARIAEPSFQDWLRYKNDREGFDIYVGMNPLKPEARTRTKTDILAIRHLYVDLDHEGPASLRTIERSSMVPEPNYVLSTSPGRFQVIWRVEEASAQQAEALLRAMADKFAGDPAATDSTRVLRLPGFLNRKYDTEFLVKAERYSSRINRLLDFKFRLEPMDSYNPHAHRLSDVSPRPSVLTQSERDWAFAKRALAGGSDPQAVMRSIAQFREGDKHNPADYARRTVDKAKAQLQQERGERAVEEAPSRAKPDR